MMRRACLLLTALVACLAWPAATAAAPFVDPLIGVRGTLASSPSITDPSLQPFGSCEGLGIVGDPLPDGYFCAPYSLDGLSVDSLDLEFFDANGDPFLTDALDHDEGNSIFNAMQPVDDTVVRLFNQDFEIAALATVKNFVMFTGLVIFTAAGPFPGDVPATFVSVRAVNGVSTVPEPAVVLLMAASLAAAGVRFRRRGAA